MASAQTTPLRSSDADRLRPDRDDRARAPGIAIYPPYRILAFPSMAAFAAIAGMVPARAGFARAATRPRRGPAILARGAGRAERLPEGGRRIADIDDPLALPNLSVGTAPPRETRFDPGERAANAIGPCIFRASGSRMTGGARRAETSLPNERRGRDPDFLCWTDGDGL